MQYSNRINLQNGKDLMIQDFSRDDEGDYSCVAENIAAARRSEALQVYTSE